jgi:competence protein ComEC
VEREGITFLVAIHDPIVDEYTDRIVETLAAIPGAEILLPPVTLGWVGLFYLLLLVWTFLKPKKWVLQFARPGLGLGILSVLVIQVWRLAWTAPDGLLHLILLDVNTNYRSGEGLLIQSPTGKVVLVNGGPSSLRLSDELGRRLAGPGGSLDAVLVAGVEENQLQALAGTLARYPPEMALWAGELQANRASRKVYSLLQSQAIDRQRLKAGMSLDLGMGRSCGF